MCDTIFTEMGSRSTRKHVRLCRVFTWIPGKMENGGPRMLCFAVVFLVFWGTLPAFRSQMGPAPENLNPVRTPGCGFRCFSWKIASRNHQYSLGFNWYIERGDDGKLDSKSTKIQLVLCRVSATFPPDSGKVVAEVSINHWYVYIFCYFFAEFIGICMKNT